MCLSTDGKMMDVIIIHHVSKKKSENFWITKHSEKVSTYQVFQVLDTRFFQLGQFV